MKDVAFFANTADDTHCLQAAFRMMLKYFLPEQDFSWKELDKMSHKEPGKGTWWFPMLLEIEKIGLRTKYIEKFDYKCFLEEGNSYVIEFYGSEAGSWYLQKSNLLDVKPLIGDFLANSQGQQRVAGLKDLDELLATGWLVGIDLNAKVLNGQPGFSSHMVLVFGKKSQNYVLHDPGLPPRPSRIVTADLLRQAWSYSGPESMALFAVKR